MEQALRGESLGIQQAFVWASIAPCIRIDGERKRVTESPDVVSSAEEAWGGHLQRQRPLATKAVPVDAPPEAWAREFEGWLPLWLRSRLYRRTASRSTRRTFPYR